MFKAGQRPDMILQNVAGRAGLGFPVVQDSCSISNSHRLNGVVDCKLVRFSFLGHCLEVYCPVLFGSLLFWGQAFVCFPFFPVARFLPVSRRAPLLLGVPTLRGAQQVGAQVRGAHRGEASDLRGDGPQRLGKSSAIQMRSKNHTDPREEEAPISSVKIGRWFLAEHVG